jgi:hypothetical protein
MKRQSESTGEFEKFKRLAKALENFPKKEVGIQPTHNGGKDASGS